jgi:lactate dehydrogenase-like 2-hydroxyacid dehydrogenase
MTDAAARPDLPLLGQVPPDVRAAVEAEYNVIAAEEVAALPAPRRAAIDRALTSAIGGASARMLDLLPGLQRIASVGAGVDRFDEADLARRGIRLLPTPHVMTEDAAEMAISLLFALCRNVLHNDAHVRSGAWAERRAGLGRRVKELRVGIVGLGRIGSAIAERLEGLGAQVHYTGRAEKPGCRHRYSPDPVSLAGAVDALVLSCVGGAATHHLVDAQVLQALGRGGYVINVARGSVVDEDALIAALSEGRIAGAGLDVFENEPTPDARFATLDNVVLSPHAAVFTQENRRDLIAEILRLLDIQQ